jgi:hypothetical protein
MRRILPLMPFVHTARPGECLVRVAWRYLLQHKQVAGHADNRALMEKRKDPHMLFPGDKLTIPDEKPMSWTLETGKRHSLVVQVPRKELRLVVRDGDGEPLASEAYELVLDGVRPEKAKRSGTTDGDGMLREQVPLMCMSATLEIADWRIQLRLGYLPPIPADETDPASGIESRLRSLGYAAGQSRKPRKDKPRVLAPDTKLALALFQGDAELDVTGEPDDETLAKIEERYGC